jgi:hypothetical protein
VESADSLKAISCLNYKLSEEPTPRKFILESDAGNRGIPATNDAGVDSFCRNWFAGKEGSHLGQTLTRFTVLHAGIETFLDLLISALLKQIYGVYCQRKLRNKKEPRPR